MPFTLTMPKLSPTMEEGAIAKWHKKEGEFVEPGDLLVEITTDKATVEYQAVDEGWLRKILIQEEETARVNQPIAVLTADVKEKIDTYLADLKKEAKAAEPEIKEAKVEEVREAVAPTAQTGMVQPAFQPLPPLEHYEFPVAREPGERVLASPLAKRMAKEQGLDLGAVRGTGPGGRVMKRDIAGAPPAALVSFGPREAPSVPPGSYTEEALTPMRKVIGKRLQQSKTFIPHFYVTQEVNAAALVELRRQLGEYGVKLSVNDFILRATALALSEKPALNSGFDSVSEKIIRFQTVDLAMAVSLEGGLITPIIRHADFKRINELSAEAKELAKRAREGKLKPEEYQGGSFTISNLGMFGITDFMAVINPPQAAILAVGGIREQAVVHKGQLIPGHILKVSVACDHRVVDGAAAAEFLGTLKHLLESPAGLLI